MSTAPRATGCRASTARPGKSPSHPERPRGAGAAAHNSERTRGAGHPSSASGHLPPGPLLGRRPAARRSGGRGANARALARRARPGGVVGARLAGAPPGEGYRLIAYDLRGHGSSSVGTDQFGTHAVRPRPGLHPGGLAGARGVVVGHSAGAIGALALAADQPVCSPNACAGSYSPRRPARNRGKLAEPPARPDRPLRTGRLGAAPTQSPPRLRAHPLRQSAGPPTCRTGPSTHGEPPRTPRCKPPRPC